MEAPVSLNCSLNHAWQKLANPELTVSQLPLVTTTSSSTVDIVSTANDLGVILDSQLTMPRHISAVCRALQAFSSYVSCGLFADL